MLAGKNTCVSAHMIFLFNFSKIITKFLFFILIFIFLYFIFLIFVFILIFIFNI